jgi:hypothetical protein
MVAVARFSRISNATGGVLASAVVNQGQNYSLEVVERVFAAADVGTGAGQTRDATDPAVGCLFAEFFGTNVKAVIFLNHFKNTTIRNTVFEIAGVGSSTIMTRFGWRVDTTPDKRTRIYLLDYRTGFAAINDGDRVRLLVQLGNI